jgi:lipopolysaccharide/colanic/teichoic acid biosynthesis glycosyltransferase
MSVIEPSMASRETSPLVAQRIKRVFDVTAALAGLLALFPLLLVVAILVKLTSRGPAFFRQERVGKDFQPFKIFKFRSMVDNAAASGRQITVGADPRITWVGRFIRKTKIDELPQLINILCGHMSFVGPRPEVQKYVDAYRDDYEEILLVRPGITDLASIKYRDEAAMLAKAENPEVEYVTRVLPEKIRLAKQYVQQQSLRLDLGIILQTILRLVGDQVAAAWPISGFQQEAISIKAGEHET